MFSHNPPDKLEDFGPSATRLIERVTSLLATTLPLVLVSRFTLAFSLVVYVLCYFHLFSLVPAWFFYSALLLIPLGSDWRNARRFLTELAARIIRSDRVAVKLFLVVFGDATHRLGPGGCWMSLYSDSFKPKDSDFYYETLLAELTHVWRPEGWLLTHELQRMAFNQQHWRMISGYAPFPFVRITTIRPGVHHVFPPHSPHGRLTRISCLPKGLYGMGDLDPDFFGESGLRNIILSMHMPDYTKALANSRRSAPYAVPRRMEVFLRSAGMDMPPPHAPAHPHPVHYALRNHALSKVARLLCGEWYALFTNPDRVQHLTSLGCTTPVGTFSPRYDGKDITRYARASVPAHHFPMSGAPVWFADDTLHHLSPSTVGSWFDSNPSLKYLICTTVIPPETCFGLQPVWPSLYTFERRGANLIYVPEGNVGGSYTQPFNGKQWLHASTVVSPANLCLHVTKLDSNYAHHIVLISREQILPETERTLDMPALTIIPWYVHPFAALQSRLTTPGLLSTLTQYAVRVSATNMRDLYAKVGATQAAQFEKFPDNYVRAAALYALYLRNTDYHYTLHWWDYVIISVARFTRLPIVAFAWAFQSYTSTSFQADHNVPHLWIIKTYPLVSQTWDSALPGVAGAICSGRMELFQLTPRAGKLERFANLSARLAVFAMSKYLGFAVVRSLDWLLHNLARSVRLAAYFLDFNWRITPFGITLTLLFYWYGIRGPHVPLPDFVTPVISFAKRSLASAFFLPSAGLPYAPGFNWPYQIALAYALLIFAFPKFHPLVLWVDRQGLTERVIQHFHWRTEARFVVQARDLTHSGISYGDAVHWVRVFHFSVVIFILLLGAVFMRRSYRVRHYNGPTCSIHQDCVVAPVFRDEEEAPPLEPAIDEPVIEPIIAPAPPVAPAPAQLAVLPPMVPGDPLRFYDLPPRVIEDYANWQNIMGRLPVPPNALDPAVSCVWHVLSIAMALPAPVLWGCFCSSLAPIRRQQFMNGSVPRGDLTAVLDFFGVSYTMRASAANGLCPRGPGMVQPLGLFDPALPPLYQVTGLPGWPNLTCYLQGNDDGTFHLTDTATPNRNAPVRVAEPWDLVGWTSISVPQAEIMEVLNLPAKAFSTVYRRLNGTLGNMFSNAPAVRMGNYVLPAVPVQKQTVLYTPTINDAEMARGLAQDLKVHPAALNLHEFNAIETSRTLDQMAKQWIDYVARGGGMRRSPVHFHLYHGAYGTGKTRQLMPDLVAQHAVAPFDSSNLAFHTWDHDLREPLRTAAMTSFPGLGLQAHNFMTGTMPLAIPRSGTVVFDDAGKCWNGFIPLFIAANPGVTDIYLTFDACQAQGSFPNAPSISRSYQSTPEWLSTFSDYYATNVVRTAADVTDLYGLPRVAVPGRPQRGGEVIVVSKSPAGVPLLAVSPRFTQTQSMGGQVANTFVESQGHTIDGDVCVDLGGLTATATEAAAWTALTRATGNIYLCMGAQLSTNAAIESCWAKSQILSAMLTVASVHRNPRLTRAVDSDGLIRAAVFSHMARCLSPAACRRLGLPAPNPIVGVAKGVNEKFRSDWLFGSNPANDVYTARTHRARHTRGADAGSPAFSQHKKLPQSDEFDIKQAVCHYTDVTNEDVLTADNNDYRLPADPTLEVQPDPILDVNEPTDDVLREIVVESGESTQQHIPDGAPDALHHTRADKLTDLLGMEKRIKLGAHTARWTSQDAARLKQLKRGFAKFFDVAAWSSDAYNPSLMERSHKYKLQSWASKRTGRSIQSSLDKQDLDAPHHYVRLFPKGQYIKKKAKWRFNAFASQTVSDFSLGRIFNDSPFATYLETKVLQHVYPSTYLHYRASPDDLSAWYKDNWRSGKMTANDYTAWDSGIDHVFLEFDLWLMQLCDFPDTFIERMRWQRLNTYSFRGVHAPRQESGDRWTWILNTVRNAALTGASLDCPARTPACFSGDDSVVLGAWRRSTHFNPSHWLMQPKRDEGDSLEFCGLVFGGTDVSYDPNVIHWRSRFGLQQGRKDEDYWRSIRDATRECASKLGNESAVLSAAALNIQRAVCWFDLPSSLLLPVKYK